MTALERLCATDEEKKIAEILSENGISTDVELLLAGDSIPQRCPCITQFVLPSLRLTDMTFRNVIDFVRLSFTRTFILSKATIY